jgi:hypothetical protein
MRVYMQKSCAQAWQHGMQNPVTQALPMAWGTLQRWPTSNAWRTCSLGRVALPIAASLGLKQLELRAPPGQRTWLPVRQPARTLAHPPPATPPPLDPPRQLSLRLSSRSARPISTSDTWLSFRFRWWCMTLWNRRQRRSASICGAVRAWQWGGRWVRVCESMSMHSASAAFVRVSRQDGFRHRMRRSRRACGALQGVQGLAKLTACCVHGADQAIGQPMLLCRC